MTSIRYDRSRRHRRVEPSWWTVLKSTLRVHRSEAVIPIITIAFVTVFAVAGYLLAHNGGAA